MTISNFLSKYIFYPLWDYKDNSIMLEMLKGLEKTQWLEAEALRNIQLKKAQDMIRYAYENCEYYKASFDLCGIRPEDIKDESDILKIPILTKKNIRENTDKLISRKFREDELISAKTGGSTGKSLMLFFDKCCEEMRNAAAIRSDRWAGWEIGVKKAALWGNPPVADTLKKRIRNGLIDRVIYLDTMNLNKKSMMEFISIYRRYRPGIIFGHSHSIYVFAKFLQENMITDLSPEGIVSTSMMLMSNERKLIEHVFHCKVTNRYGCEEVGLIGCECERHEGMHINIDHLYVEFVREDGSAAGPGKEGAIVITDLINHGMPLIRYRIEDVGIPTDKKCSCGRGLPVMASVSGRVADFLVKKDGSLVAGVSLVERTLTAIKGIEQMQIVQESIDKIILNIVKGKDYTLKSEQKVLYELKTVFGENIQLIVNYIDKILQESSGKYRFSICKIPYS